MSENKKPKIQDPPPKRQKKNPEPEDSTDSNVVCSVCGSGCMWRPAKDEKEREARKLAHELRMKRIDEEGEICRELMEKTEKAAQEIMTVLKPFIEQYSSPPLPEDNDDGTKYQGVGMAVRFSIDAPEKHTKTPEEILKSYMETLEERVHNKSKVYAMECFYNVDTSHWWFSHFTGRGGIEAPIVFFNVKYSTPVDNVVELWE